MATAEQRKALKDQYRESPRQAGVFRVLNTKTGRSLIGSAVNLASVQSKIDFMRKTGVTGMLDRRIDKDLAQYGIAAFEYAVLEEFTPPSDATANQVRADLETLEALWRERFDPATLF
jgi:hypothetical protein